MASGYVKLHRGLLDHWVFADDAMFYLWTNLLMRANWKDGKVWPGGSSAPLTVRRGQLLTGRNSLHQLLYPTHDKNGKKIKRESQPPHPTTIWRWLEAMEKDGMLKLDVRKQFTVISICNYDLYQNYDDPDAPPVRKRRASGAPPVRHPCATDAPPVRTIEEGKEREEGKKETPFPPSLDNPEFRLAWDDFSLHRSEIRKPLTATAEKKMLARLEGWGSARAIAAIEHSIANGWRGVFEPKDAEVASGKPGRPLTEAEYETWNPIDGGGA